ncbi:MAG: hypothetical protein AB7O24_02205 [Kofleriaceae bacterium]
MKWFAMIVGFSFALGAACTEPRVCSTTPGPEMRPGWNCLSCHREEGQAKNKVWSAGGTVYESLDSDQCDGTPDVEVVFFNPNGVEIERVRTNDAGNFHTSKPLPKGFRVGVERDGKRAMMPIPPPAGSCNACHAASPIGGAKGVIRAP